MSDCLGRIAARAVGEAPRAQPRLPALFERIESPVSADAGSPIANERVMAPSPPAPAPIHGSSPRPQETVLAPPSAPGGLGGANLAHQVLVPATREAARAEGVQPAGQVRTDSLADAVLAAAAQLDAGEPVPSESAPAAAVPAVPASAAPLPITAPTKGPGAAQTVAHEDTSTVRVHIGRLEVRANLENAAPAPPTRAAEPRSQGLTLADYLRGKRVAG